MFELPSVDEAEKGLVSLVLTVPHNALPLHGSGHMGSPPGKVSTDTKSLDPITAPLNAVQSSSEVRPPPAKPTRRKTNRWVRFQLWYNTYQYVAQSPNPLSKGNVFDFMLPESFLHWSC